MAWRHVLGRHFYLETSFQIQKKLPFFPQLFARLPKPFRLISQGVWTPGKAPRSSRRPRDLPEVKCKRLRLYRCGQRPMGLRPMVAVEILSRKQWRVRTYNVLQVKVLLYEWNLLLESWARDKSQKDVFVFYFVVVVVFLYATNTLNKALDQKHVTIFQP